MHRMNPDKHADIVRLIVRSMEGKLSEEETQELADGVRNDPGTMRSSGA